MSKSRIVRRDSHNVAVEELVTIVNKKDGSERQEWQEVGYYGHRLELAAQQALFSAMPIGTPVTPEMLDEAVRTICRETMDALDVGA